MHHGYLFLYTAFYTFKRPFHLTGNQWQDDCLSWPVSRPEFSYRVSVVQENKVLHFEMSRKEKVQPKFRGIQPHFLWQREREWIKWFSRFYCLATRFVVWHSFDLKLLFITARFSFQLSKEFHVLFIVFVLIFHNHKPVSWRPSRPQAQLTGTRAEHVV